jgi:hypothetical protein
MRQRAFVIHNTCEIARINQPPPLVAFEEVLALVERWSVDALAEDGFGSSMVMIAVMCTSQKNQAPVSRGPILYGVRRTFGRAAIVVPIVTAVAAVKLLARRVGDGLASFYLNADLLGAIAQATLKGAHVSQFHEDSRPSHHRIASELFQVRWRAGRGTNAPAKLAGTTGRGN